MLTAAIHTKATGPMKIPLCTEQCTRASLGMHQRTIKNSPHCLPRSKVTYMLNKLCDGPSGSDLVLLASGKKLLRSGGGSVTPVKPFPPPKPDIGAKFISTVSQLSLRR
jgi:hypothetical protein